MNSDTDVTKLFLAQKSYFAAHHSNWDVKVRRKKLKRFRDIFLKYQPQIRQALWNDFRKPEVEVDLSEIKIVLDEIDLALSNLRRWMKMQRVKTPLLLFGARSRILNEPKGVCLILAPWNFPFNLTFGPLVSAIAAGNCVIVKPSELSTHSSALMQKIIAEVFEPHEVSVLLGDASLAKKLLELPFFNHIFFTGSPEIGKIVMTAAAKHLSSVTLELGGKNPVIVDKSANIRDTAERLIYGKFLNTGQSCVSPNYVFVPKRDSDKLCNALREELARRYPGKAEENPDFGRLIHPRHFKRVEALLNDALSKGAELLQGGDVNAGTSFIAPTILTNLSDDAKVLSNEIFGPLLPVITYEHLDSVLEYINSGEKPLALYIFSKNKKNIAYILKHTSSGTVAINETTLQFFNNHLPFGGINFSGLGKAHGYSGFLAFSNRRSILIQKSGFTGAALIRPPYTGFVKKFTAFILRFL